MYKHYVKAVVFILIIPFLASCASTMKAPSMKAMVASGERMISYTAYLTFEVNDLDQTRELLIEKSKQVHGFITRETNEYLVIRIPASEFESFVNIISEIGKISESEIHGEDITDSYDDIKLQLDSKIKLRDKYDQILIKADKVEDIISIEKELERINLEIQRLEGLKIAAEKNVQYITVNIEIKKKITPGPIGWIFYLGYKAIKWLFIWK